MDEQQALVIYRIMRGIECTDYQQQVKQKSGRFHSTDIMVQIFIGEKLFPSKKEAAIIAAPFFKRMSNSF